jgi:precorrin isomerase
MSDAIAEQGTYLRDGTAIYRRSFAIIRAEADLARFTPEEAEVAVRMIHACGQVEVAQHIVFRGNVVEAARRALTGGAPILCDSEMVAHGITRARLPSSNKVICTLNDPRAAAIAAKIKTTRSAAALDLWLDRLAGAVVASAMRRRRSSACSNSWTPARRNLRQFSACPLVLSAPRNPRRRWPLVLRVCRF